MAKRRKTQSQPADALPSQENLTEVGATGTKFFAGQLNDEYLQVLSDPSKAVPIYDRMRKSDATVHSACLVAELPIKAANFAVIPATKDPADIERAAFVQHCLFESQSQTWSDLIHMILSYLQFGFSVFEVVDKVEDWHHSAVRRGKVQRKFSRSRMIKWRKWAFRHQATIDEWALDENGGLKGIYQDVSQSQYRSTSAEQRPYMSIENLLVFTNQRLGSNFAGISNMRSAYKHWLMKDGFYKVEAVGIERNATGTPVMKQPSRVTREDKEAAKKILKGIRIHEESGVLLPSGWEFAIIEGAINNIALQNAIRHHDTKIFQAVLASFLQLGQETRGGSYALSTSLIDFFVMALNAVASQICDIIDRYAIKRIVDLNYNNTVKYPYVRVEPISPANKEQWANALSTLAGAGYIRPYSELETYITKLFGLPDNPELDIDVEEAPESKIEVRVPTQEQPLKQVVEQPKQDIMTPKTKIKTDKSKVVQAKDANNLSS